jgi:predicted GNAT family N-acyltransferase
MLTAPTSRVGAKLVATYALDVTQPEELARLEMLRLQMSAERPRGAGRPTKRERRDLDDFFDIENDEWFESRCGIMSTEPITVRRIAAADTRLLRHLVLWPHLERMEQCVTVTDEEDGAIHLGAFMNDTLIGICSLFRTHSSRLAHVRQYRLRAMATHPEYRGVHAGAALVREACRQLRNQDTEVLWCDARLNAEGFYTRLGFSHLEEVYEVPRIGPHRFMWIELQGTDAANQA